MLSVKRYECACAQPNLEAAVGFVTLALGLAGGVCGLVELCAQVLHLVLQRGNLSQASKAREEGDGATAGTVLSQQIEGGGEKQTPAKTNQGEHTHTHTREHTRTHTRPHNSKAKCRTSVDLLRISSRSSFTCDSSFVVAADSKRLRENRIA